MRHLCVVRGVDMGKRECVGEYHRLGGGVLLWQFLHGGIGDEGLVWGALVGGEVWMEAIVNGMHEIVRGIVRLWRRDERVVELKVELWFAGWVEWC